MRTGMIQTDFLFVCMTVFQIEISGFVLSVSPVVFNNTTQYVFVLDRSIKFKNWKFLWSLSQYLPLLVPCGAAQGLTNTSWPLVFSTLYYCALYMQYSQLIYSSPLLYERVQWEWAREASWVWSWALIKSLFPALVLNSWAPLRDLYDPFPLAACQRPRGIRRFDDAIAIIIAKRVASGRD